MAIGGVRVIACQHVSGADTMSDGKQALADWTRAHEAIV